MIIIFAAIFFILGLIIGSFLNVVVYRMNTSRSLGGRSACMFCKHVLSWYELVPLFSFMALRGRCKNCKTKIAFQYPAVEFITGLLFAILFWKLQDVFLFSPLTFFIPYVYYSFLFSILLVIAVYDLKHKIIPDTLAFTFSLVAFIGLFFLDSSSISFGGYVFSPHLPKLVTLFSGVFVALPFALLWVVSRGAWIGLGDAKLALGLGWFLGLGRAFSGIVLSFWAGAIIGIGLIVFKKGYGMKSEIPFAVFLILGAFLAFIFDLHLFTF